MHTVISSTGLWTPKQSISNEELVTAYNAYAKAWNTEHVQAIADGHKQALEPSSADFIEKASGILSRYVISKEPILDPEIMAPHIPARSNEEPSLLAEIACKAALQALENAGRNPEQIDALIIACSNLQRAYPAIAIEVQDLLGTGGFAFDMNVACSSATFGIETARGLIMSGQAQSVLVCNPEICSAHLNFKDRDSHFIFGDVATAILVERAEIAPPAHWQITSTKLITQFSNNIRNNFGFLNPCAPEDDGLQGDQGRQGLTDKLFMQNGRHVFREVVPLVAQLIRTESEKLGLVPGDLKRLWLHQANLNMNHLIAKKILGPGWEVTEPATVPIVLDEYANTSSAGSIIAFHKYNDDFQASDQGLICSFGAGYSVGAIFVQKVG